MSGKSGGKRNAKAGRKAKVIQMPAPEPQFREPQTAREVLDIIDKFFMSRGRDSSEPRKLWNILCGLRGPDSVSDMEKEAFTLPIRHAAFPETSDGRILRNTGAYASPDSPERASERERMLGAIPWHFRDHARFAFEALGLVFKPDAAK